MFLTIAFIIAVLAAIIGLALAQVAETFFPEDVTSN